MCTPMAVATVGSAVIGAHANKRNTEKTIRAQERARRRQPATPTYADASVRNAGNLARRIASAGGQSSTRRSGNPLGLPGNVGNARTLLGG